MAICELAVITKLKLFLRLDNCSNTINLSDEVLEMIDDNKISFNNKKQNDTQLLNNENYNENQTLLVNENEITSANNQNNENQNITPNNQNNDSPFDQRIAILFSTLERWVQKELDQHQQFMKFLTETAITEKENEKDKDEFIELSKEKLKKIVQNHMQEKKMNESTDDIEQILTAFIETAFIKDNKEEKFYPLSVYQCLTKLAVLNEKLEPFGKDNDLNQPLTKDNLQKNSELAYLLQQKQELELILNWSGKDNRKPLTVDNSPKKKSEGGTDVISKQLEMKNEKGEFFFQGISFEGTRYNKNSKYAESLGCDTNHDKFGCVTFEMPDMSLNNNSEYDISEIIAQVSQQTIASLNDLYIQEKIKKIVMVEETRLLKDKDYLAELKKDKESIILIYVAEANNQPGFIKGIVYYKESIDQDKAGWCFFSVEEERVAKTLWQKIKDLGCIEKIKNVSEVKDPEKIKILAPLALGLVGGFGATFSSVLIQKNQEGTMSLHISALGDSPIDLVFPEEENKWLLRKLTQDHNGSNEREHGHISKNKGAVVSSRIYPGGIEVSRALADFGTPVACKSEQSFLELNEQQQKGAVIFASDGLWEHFYRKLMADLFNKIEEFSVDQLFKLLDDLSTSCVDNRTFGVINLAKLNLVANQVCHAFVSDGHGDSRMSRFVEENFFTYFQLFLEKRVFELSKPLSIDKNDSKEEKSKELSEESLADCIGYFSMFKNNLLDTKKFSMLLKIFKLPTEIQLVCNKAPKCQAFDYSSGLTVLNQPTEPMFFKALIFIEWLAAKVDKLEFKQKGQYQQQINGLQKFVEGKRIAFLKDQEEKAQQLSQLLEEQCKKKSTSNNENNNGDNDFEMKKKEEKKEKEETKEKKIERIFGDTANYNNYFRTLWTILHKGQIKFPLKQEAIDCLNKYQSYLFSLRATSPTWHTVRKDNNNIRMKIIPTINLFTLKSSQEEVCNAIYSKEMRITILRSETNALRAGYLSSSLADYLVYYAYSKHKKFSGATSLVIENITGKNFDGIAKFILLKHYLKEKEKGNFADTMRELFTEAFSGYDDEVLKIVRYSPVKKETNSIFSFLPGFSDPKTVPQVYTQQDTSDQYKSKYTVMDFCSIEEISVPCKIDILEHKNETKEEEKSQDPNNTQENNQSISQNDLLKPMTGKTVITERNKQRLKEDELITNFLKNFSNKSTKEDQNSNLVPEVLKSEVNNDNLLNQREESMKEMTNQNEQPMEIMQNNNENQQQILNNQNLPQSPFSNNDKKLNFN